jgi:hypothetical protein
VMFFGGAFKVLLFDQLVFSAESKLRTDPFPVSPVPALFTNDEAAEVPFHLELQSGFL